MTRIISLPVASRDGKRDTGWLKLPDTIGGKLQVSVSVDAADREVSAKELAATIQFSSDGQKPDRPSYRMTWRGNAKAFKPGWPGDGPAMRVDNLFNGQPWMRALFMRVEVDTPAAVKCAVNVDVIDGVADAKT